MKIFTTVTLGVIYFASSVLAGSGYFTVPAQDSIFQTGDEIHFYTKDSVDSDESDFFTAELYRENGKKVRTISTFPGDLDDEHFIFSWKIDTTIKSGRYFAEMTSSDDDGDIIQSHIFEIVNSEEEKYYNDMDPMMDGISIADSMSDQMGMMDPMSMGDPMAGMADPMAGMADPMAGMGGMASYGDPMAGMADPMAGMADPMAGMGGMADPMAGMANSFADPMDTFEPMSGSMDTVELAGGVSPIGQVDQSNSLDNSFQYDSGP